MLSIFFFWSLILKDCIEVQEKKKKVVLLFTSSAKTLNKALPRSSRAVVAVVQCRAKMCTKKRDARAKLLFCLFFAVLVDVAVVVA